MRRTCIMLLILPAGLSPVAAADNPFSKPKPVAQPAVPGETVAPESQPLVVPLLRPVSPSAVTSSEPLQPASSGQTTKPDPASLSGFKPVSMADILLAGLPTRIAPPQSPSDVSIPGPLSERELPEEQSVPENDPTAVDPLDDYDLDDEPKEDNLLFAPSIYGKNRLAEVAGERIAIPPLIVPTTSTDKIGNKTLPDDIGGEALVMSKPLPEGFDRYEDWSLTSYFWQAPNTFSHPLYFDDPMLERHGHERFPCLTPMISGARFFATFAMLPYLSTVQEPCDCVYTLGHFRPGSCAPPLLKRPPYERRAAIVQGLSTAGFFVAWP